MLELYVSSVILGLCISGSCCSFPSAFPSLWIDADHQHGADGLLHFGAYLTMRLSPGRKLLLGFWSAPWCSSRGFLVETQLLRRVYGKELMFTMVSPSASS